MPHNKEPHTEAPAEGQEKEQSPTPEDREKRLREKQLREKQLRELRGDPDFKQLLSQSAKRLMRSWGFSYADAESYVVSAIGEPSALARICEALNAVRSAEGRKDAESTRRARCELAVICRRRVIDLMRKDARRPDHFSLPMSSDDADQLETSFVRSSRSLDIGDELQRHELKQMVQRALDCFGHQGDNEERQALLLRRRQLEELDYPSLSIELSCSQGALRVRLHAAMKAFYRHVERCHPELVAFRQPTTRKRNKA